MRTKLFLLLLLLATSAVAFGQTGGVGTSDSDVVNMVSAAIQKSADSLLTDCVKWLGMFMVVQLIITNLKLLPSADMDSAMAKFVGSIIWFSFCWYLMDVGPGFIKSVGNQFWNKFAASIPTPGVILASGFALGGGLVGLAAIIGGTVVGAVIAQGIMALGFLIAGAGVYFAYKAFLLQIEIMLVAMLSPLSFSLLGLNALRDQGIAPLKSLLSLVYRIVLYGVVFVALTKMFSVMGDVVDHYTSLNWDSVANLATGGKDILKATFAALAGELLLLFLLWKADSIASSLAGGSSSLGAADMAGAVAAGVTAGMAANSAAQAMMRPAQGMGDIMRGLMGKGMDMNNASPQGTGGLGDLARPDLGGSMSVADGAGGDAGGDTAGGSGGGAGGEQKLPPNTNEFSGVSNPLPGGETRDSGRDAAREARRQARTGGSGRDASIAGPSGGGTDDTLKQIADALSKPRAKGLGERLGDTNQHVAQERATTSVHVNTHHD